MESKGQEEAKWVDFLDIGPGSSPAEFLLNERMKRLSNEERIEEISQLMQDFFAKPVFLGVNKHVDDCLLCLLKMLKKSFEIVPYNPLHSNREYFNLSLRRIYQSSIVEDYSSALKFSRVKREVWKEIMADWHSELYAESWDQEVLSFFLGCGLLASGEEKEIMSDVLRQRLKKSKAKDIEAWVKWMQEQLPSKSDSWFTRGLANEEIGRRWAMARASDGGWDLLLQDIRDKEMAETLLLRDFNPDLLPALRATRDRIAAIDQAAKILAEKIQIHLSLDLALGESISYKINSPELLTVNVYCASARSSYRGGYPEIPDSICGLMKKERYLLGFGGGVLLSGYSANLLLNVCGLQGNVIIEKNLLQV